MRNPNLLSLLPNHQINMTVSKMNWYTCSWFSKLSIYYNLSVFNAKEQRDPSLAMAFDESVKFMLF